MVSDLEKTRPDNKILMNENWNFSGMMADNTSKRALYQCNILIAIKRWGLVYSEVGKSKIANEYKLIGIS